MKKTLIIASMLFTSATVWGMMPNDPNGSSGKNHKRNYAEFSENTEESSRNVRPKNSTSELLDSASEDEIAGFLPPLTEEDMKELGLV